LPESRPAPFPLRVVRDPDQAQQELARVATRNVGSSQQQARSVVDEILDDVRQREMPPLLNTPNVSTAFGLFRSRCPKTI